MRSVRNAVIRALVVVGITVFALLLSAILLPPKDSTAMPRDGGGDAPVASPR